MKNFILKSLLCAFVISSMTSCAVYRDFKYDYNTSPICDLLQTPVTNGVLETDLEMIGEVTATYTILKANNSKLEEGVYLVDDDFLFRLKSEKASLLYAEAKARVLQIALEKANCDMILAPIYKLEVAGRKYSSNGYTFRDIPSTITYTISVKGFGANIKGVKQIKTNE